MAQFSWSAALRVATEELHQLETVPELSSLLAQQVSAKT